MLCPSETNCTGKTPSLGHVPGLSNNSGLLTFVKTMQPYTKIHLHKSATFILKKNTCWISFIKKFKHFFFTFIKTAQLVCTMMMPRACTQLCPRRPGVLDTCSPRTPAVVTALQQGTLHLPPVPGTSQSPTGWLQHIPGKAGM